MASSLPIAGSPSPPGRRSLLSGTTSNTTNTTIISSPEASRRSVSLSHLPPPPNMMTTSSSSSSSPNKSSSSAYAENLARSMSIDELRQLHYRSQQEAQAKETELRLVLASRYRELVGSSDEVTKMRERAQELHDLMQALPRLMETLLEKEKDEESKQPPASDTTTIVSHEKVILRQELRQLTRAIHRSLDQQDVHGATQSLLTLLGHIARNSRRQEYPLAEALHKPTVVRVDDPLRDDDDDDMVRAQVRMTFLHVQTLPATIRRLSQHLLQQHDHQHQEAHTAAGALASLQLLQLPSATNSSSRRPMQLVDVYLEAKARLLQQLLGQLSSSSSSSSQELSEEVMSKIVRILQYDIILHPYQIFVLRKVPVPATHAAAAAAVDVDVVFESLPRVPPSLVQSKISNFLSAHLPLVRTKVKSVLVDIAGTTASALGKIRQSLYDQTDGCIPSNNDGHGTWEEAVAAVVDLSIVMSSSGSSGSSSSSPNALATLAPSTDNSNSSGIGMPKFSLWGVLFSGTFSSLVHSLLTTSFQSVHSMVVSSLRLSLANAPPLSAMLPHEAYRNALHIASELDTALIKLSDDAHELLVHAEERVESERRLRQSLYVQTCEIMGRLLCELRRMLLVQDQENASVKELIVGRLCHLLKFRLTALPKLLDPNSSPAVLLGSSSGMISLMELQSAFDLADDNEDGLITFSEAMEAVDSAFSGTPFHGAEMVRETLLLPTTNADAATNSTNTLPDVTLSELTLLLARGLRQGQTGRQSALGTYQESLDKIIASCFNMWAKEVLKGANSSLSSHVTNFCRIASTQPEDEVKRLYASSESSTGGSMVVMNISPHIIDFVLQVSFTLNRSICPSDSLFPAPSLEYAGSMGIEGSDIPNMMDTMRWSLLVQAFESAAAVLTNDVGVYLAGGDVALRNSGPSGLAQLMNDLSFVQTCFLKRNRHGFGSLQVSAESKTGLERLIREVEALVRRSCDRSTPSQIEERHKHVMEVCDLYLSSLLGEDTSSVVQLADLGDMSSGSGFSGASPLLHSPMPSTCRFPLLPIQADRTLSGVQARGKYKDKEDAEGDDRGGQDRVGAVRAGLGFFSSMLKKT